MNEKTRGIVIGTVVLAALGATLGVMKLTGADKVPGDSSSETSVSSSEADDESIPILEVGVNDITKVTVTNSQGGYTFEAASASGKDNAYIDEIKGLSLAQIKVNDVAGALCNLSAYKLAEKGAEDLSKYGLTEPLSEIKIDFADGSTRTFCIGDKAHDDRYCYFCEKLSSDVYMVLTSVLEPYMKSKEQFIDCTLIAKTEDPSQNFGKLTLKRKDLDYDMVFETDDGSNERSNADMPSAQVMTEPIFSYLDGVESSDVIYSLYGLTAMSAEVVFPTDEQKTEYGMDDPNAVITFTGNGYDYTLTIGNEYHETNEKGVEQSAVSAYYCTIDGAEGKDCIWKVDASALPWMTLKPGDVITGLMTWNMVTDVAEFKVSGEENADFALTSGKDGDRDVLESVKLDGKDADLDSFKGFYQFFLTCPTSEIVFEGAPEGDPYLTLEVVTNDGYTDKIELFHDTERRSIAKLNGRTCYRIQSKWTDRFLKNLDAVKNGGTVDQDY